MALTHHPVRLFRLSCGCLREYPMMPEGTRHEVLCPRCRRPAFTVLAYPEKCCGARGWDCGRQLACTRAPGECTLPWHLDGVAGTEFSTQAPRLTRASDGKTGRA